MQRVGQLQPVWWRADARSSPPGIPAAACRPDATWLDADTPDQAGRPLAGSQIEGEQEVLFPDNTVFQVTRIVNDRDLGHTFFVYITQRAGAPGGVPIKNPFTGTTY